MLLQELELLKVGEPVYKLFGKVLVKQDVTEAMATVKDRLAFITTEM